MEPIQGTLKASRFEPEDFISNMPDNVISDIMNRLPIQEAVGTSILARNWRYKWTMLSELVFDKNFFECSLGTEREADCGRIISRLLLHITGVVTKFVLSVDKACYPLIVEDITHWILFLSRKGIKDVTLELRGRAFLDVPDHLFSCLELKRLKLVSCWFYPPASFHGFPNLLSLDLQGVSLGSEELFVNFLTLCPILENLNMNYMANNISSTTILELMGFLPKLQNLHMNFRCCTFNNGVAEKMRGTTFPALKALKLSKTDLRNGIELSYAFQMISSFPNLQTLEILSTHSVAAPTPGICSLEVDYNTMGLLELQSVVFTNLKGSENEVCLIKYVLASSPFLKMISIHLHPCLTSEEKFMFARNLVKFHRASPTVDIDLGL